MEKGKNKKRGKRNERGKVNGKVEFPRIFLILL